MAIKIMTGEPESFNFEIKEHVLSSTIRNYVRRQLKTLEPVLCLHHGRNDCPHAHDKCSVIHSIVSGDNWIGKQYRTSEFKCRHIRHELNGVEFKISEKFRPKEKIFEDLSKIVAKKNNGFDKYKYDFELEKSVVNDFQIHEMNKMSVST